MNRSLMNPSVLLATWFGTGLAPFAPGTFGTLAAYPLALPLAFFFGWQGLLLAAAAITAIGVWAAGSYGANKGLDDPQEVVIDEVAGLLFVLAIAPFEILAWIAAFLAFRVFDILKPWPCNWLDRSLKGGVGVMADDLAAAIYAALVILALGEFGAW